MWDRARPHDRREGLFGGRGEVRVWDLLGARKPAPFEAVLACELDPAGRVGDHVQEAFDEIVVFVAGEGTATVNGARVELHPGATIPLQLGQVLSIENGSTHEPLRYLIVKARATTFSPGGR